MCETITIIIIKMKKLFSLLLLTCVTLGAHAFELNGKYLSLSGELMFRFSGDSLYIDMAQSQRNVSSFKLVKIKDTKKISSFNAYETYLKDGKATYREVHIRVTKLKGKKCLFEYFGKDKDRDYNSNERYTIRLVD